MDDDKLVACCKVESVDKVSYDDLMLNYKAIKSIVRAGRKKEREERENQ